MVQRLRRRDTSHRCTGPAQERECRNLRCRSRLMRQSAASKLRCAKRRKRLGICRDCPLPARKGKVKCSVCFQKDINRQNEWLKTQSWKKAAKAREVAYGISNERYCEMFFEQNGRCGICGCFLVKPHLDHDHESNEVRGILCSRCNTGLAFLENRPLSTNAEQYLRGDRPWQILNKQSS